MYANVFKNNPYHDGRGRFTSKDSSTFFSPNVKEGLSVAQGAGNLRSSEQRRYKIISDKVDTLLGLKPSAKDAVGAWTDGGENSIVNSYPGADFGKVQASVAMKGLLAQQKAVIAYRTKAGGPSRMHTMTDLPKAEAQDISSALSQAGIEYHTLVRNGSAYDVMVFEEHKNPALSAKVVDFAHAAGAKVHHTDGEGKFIGSWDSRQEGTKAYNRVINDYLSGKPAEKRAWDSLLKNHKFRELKMAGLFMGVS